MTPEETGKTLKEKFGEAVIEVNTEGGVPHAVVDPSRFADVCAFMKSDENLSFDFLSNQSGRDLGEKLEVICLLYSYKHKHSFALKTRVPRENPKVPSAANIWAAADWFEREIFDMFGIRFEGHPDLRRIFLPPDWEGFPLRKDYVYPTSYGGMDFRRDEEGWPDPGPKPE